MCIRDRYLYYNFGQWYVKEGSIPEFVDERLIQFNKQQAMSLLSQTDWTTMADITTGTHKLTNQADFIAYRDQIRIIAVNPTANVTWPTMPTEQWSS